MARSAIIPRSTNSFCTKARASSIFSFSESSFCSAMSKLYAGCALGWRSAASTGVPERCSVTEARRSMSRQQNFRMENAALARVVADFVVIFAVQAFARAICCGGKGTLSCASLDLRNGEMIQCHQLCSNDGIPRGSCAIWFSSAKAKRMFSISSSSSSSVISRRMSCTSESAKMRSMTR